MWGWLQERRKVGSYDYAGCLSVPRIMYLRGDRLHQEPAPEVGLHLHSCMYIPVSLTHSGKTMSGPAVCSPFT